MSCLFVFPLFILLRVIHIHTSLGIVRILMYMLYSCESVRKAIERVFGILKKRFHILKIPFPML